MSPLNLFSTVRSEIFRLLFGVTPNELYLREIERRTQLNVTTIRHELKLLSELNLITSRREGNYQYTTRSRIMIRQ
jgi:DNA-binding transcriptional ArsR family regulator